MRERSGKKDRLFIVISFYQRVSNHCVHELHGNTIVCLTVWVLLSWENHLIDGACKDFIFLALKIKFSTNFVRDISFNQVRFSISLEDKEQRAYRPGARHSDRLISSYSDCQSFFILEMVVPPITTQSLRYVFWFFYYVVHHRVFLHYSLLNHLLS